MAVHSPIGEGGSGELAGLFSGVPKWVKGTIGGVVIVASIITIARQGSSDAEARPFQPVVPAAAKPLHVVMPKEEGARQAVLVELPGGTLKNPVGLEYGKGRVTVCLNQALGKTAAEALQKPDEVFSHGCTTTLAAPVPTADKPVVFPLSGHGVTVQLQTAGNTHDGVVDLTVSAAIDKAIGGKQ